MLTIIIHFPHDSLRLISSKLFWSSCAVFKLEWAVKDLLCCIFPEFFCHETGILDGLTWNLNILPHDIRSKGEGISEQSFVLGQRATYQDIT